MAGAAFPQLYPILDVTTLLRISDGGDVADLVERAAKTFFEAGIEILQLRAKSSTPQEMLALSEAIKAARDAAGTKCKIILNDRPDLALLAGFEGCHLGQQDLSVVGARRMLPRPKILGRSTHDAAQIKAANESDADYIAIGPIFATSTKENPDSVIGVDGLARLRASARKPVVAIGGITRANFRSVVDAGADSVAVIGNLLVDCTASNLESQLTQNIRDFLD
jgi:thiamine-phosphate pyrophosphorylase